MATVRVESFGHGMLRVVHVADDKVETTFEGELEDISLNMVPLSQKISEVAAKYGRLPANTEDVIRVYEHWRETRGRTRKNYDRMSPGRRRKIEARLKEFSADDLCQAISNVANDPWEDRPKHDDIMVIFRNREQVERFMEMTESPVKVESKRFGYGMTTTEILDAAAQAEIVTTAYELNAGS